MRTYEMLQHIPALESLLAELHLTGSRIGAELGREQYLELSYQDFEELRRRMPAARFEDGSDLLLQLRVVKSPREVTKLEASASLTARALHRTLAEAREGMAGTEVARRLRTALMEEGAEAITFLAVGSGLDFSRGRITCATPRPIRRGETLTLDTGVELAGYCSDVTRMAVVGEPSAEQRRMYRLMREVQQACIEAFRPGATCADIVAVCQEMLQRAGRTTQPVGRIGHGVGLESTEYPSLAAWEKVLLATGMVFACNPNYVTSVGYFNSEENLVVTEGGYRLLSVPAAPEELPAIR
ncbi:MAG: aminopeptidase P family protein [Acidobacteria bacterium]|nr:MAG: aminopeptidase P family protein [Acidobacteriota bacterium]